MQIPSQTDQQGVPTRSPSLAGQENTYMPSDPIYKSLVRLVMMAFLVMLPLLLLTPSPAFGYADPGSGAFLYQAVYAAFLGGAFYLRKLLNRIWRKRK